MYLGGGVIVIV